MKVLVLGAGGQVGHELAGFLRLFADVDAPGRELDLADAPRLVAAIEASSPHAIVNCASFNDVDGAEKDPDAALAVNARAVVAIGRVAKERGIAVVHYSTDFVFDGEKAGSYVETDPTRPLSAYGRSKLEGEEGLAATGAAAIVLRTAWVYSLRRKSFVTAILNAARTRDELKVVADQTGSPTFARDLAAATAMLLHGARSDLVGTFERARGVYHLAGSGACTRHELAVAALEIDPNRAEQRARRVLPIPTSEYPLPAKRPANAPLDCSKIERVFGLRLPPWRDGLARALAKRIAG